MRFGIKAYLIFVTFFYTIAIWCLEVLHLKLRKFATRVDSRQNSIMNCLNTMIWMLNCKSNDTLCKIAIWVKHYTVCILYCIIASSVEVTLFRAVSFFYPVENFTLDSIFYITNGCDGWDKYEVCIKVWSGQMGQLLLQQDCLVMPKGASTVHS